MGVSKTNDQFTKELYDKFGDSIISKENYITSETEMTFLCSKHGEFLSNPSKILTSKYGCRKCSIEQRAITRTIPDKKCEFCGSEDNVTRYKGGKMLCRKHRHHMEYHGKVLEKTIFDANDIKIYENHIEIILENKEHEYVGSALISKEDAELVLKYKWHLRPDGYIGSYTFSKKTILHRLIVDAKKGQHVDHINRNKLDCRRNNLRICEQRENVKNAGMRKDNTSGVRGVRFTANGYKRPYKAEIFVDKKKISLGRFFTLEEAKKARRDAEIKYFGEFAPDWSDSL